VLLPDDVEEMLDRVVANDAGAADRLPGTKRDVQEAWLRLSTQPPPPKMPHIYLRVLTWVYRRGGDV
jgi:hypothetical protein